MLQSHKKQGAFIVAWVILHSAVFYLFFIFSGRFLAPLIPLLALSGGYCIARLWSRRSKVFIYILLLIPLVASVRLSVLAFQSDTLAHSYGWAMQNLGPQDKVLVLADELRLPMTAAGVAELRSIGPDIPKSTDLADEMLDRRDIPYALNIYALHLDTGFLNQLPAYAGRHGYTYLILTPDIAGTTTRPAIESLTSGATVVQRFNGFGNSSPAMSVMASEFSAPLTTLFEDKLLGTDVVIYRLQ